MQADFIPSAVLTLPTGRVVHASRRARSMRFTAQEWRAARALRNDLLHGLLICPALVMIDRLAVMMGDERVGKTAERRFELAQRVLAEAVQHGWMTVVRNDEGTPFFERA